MDQLMFDKIHREVLEEISPTLVNKLKAFFEELNTKLDPQKTTKEQLFEELEEAFIFSVATVFAEAARAANLTVQKYHQCLENTSR